MAAIESYWKLIDFWLILGSLREPVEFFLNTLICICQWFSENFQQQKQTLVVLSGI